MHAIGSRSNRRRASAAVGGLVLCVAGYAAPAAAGPAAAHTRPQLVSVSPTPAPGTPELVPSTGSTTNRIRQMVQCGSTMYAVGRFSQVTQGGRTFSRDNVFSFKDTAPYTVTSWAPRVNDIVNSIAFSGSSCSDAYIGGDFSSVGNARATHIAAISTTTGALVHAFGASATGGDIETLLGVAGHLLVGGYFTSINGSHNPYMASVSPVTGTDDGFLHLHISGYYHYCNHSGKCTTGKDPYVYNQQLSHGGTLDLVEGDFTSVGGLPRQQIFMLNLAASRARVTGWTSPEWDGSQGNLPGGYPYQCVTTEAFYLRSAAWSPDDQTVYTAATGFHPWNQSTKVPRTGLCDAAAAFPATQTSVTHKWVSYTGCYSLYAAAADASTAYFAGHPRYANNPDGCKSGGPGAIKDSGMQGLAVATGSDRVTSKGAALYTMSKANADSMLFTTAGLWISSSNRYGSQTCGRVKGHSGICLLPYSSASPVR